MTVWKLIRRAHLGNPLSGEGAARFGNRWNSRGVRMAYAAGSRSLAALEMLVHVSRESVPAQMLLAPVEVPDKLIAELKDLPPGRNEFPFRYASQETGDEWIRKGKSLGLLVPSAVVAGERNLLINPRHGEFWRVKVGPPEVAGLNGRLF